MLLERNFQAELFHNCYFFCYTHLYRDQILGYFPALSNKTQLEHTYRTGCITEHPIGEQATLETQLSNAYYNEKCLELRPYLNKFMLIIILPSISMNKFTENRLR